MSESDNQANTNHEQDSQTQQKAVEARREEQHSPDEEPQNIVRGLHGEGENIASFTTLSEAPPRLRVRVYDKARGTLVMKWAWRFPRLASAFQWYIFLDVIDNVDSGFDFVGNRHDMHPLHPVGALYVCLVAHATRNR